MFNQTLETAKQLQGRMKDREGTQRKHNGENLEEDKKMFKNPKPLRKEGEWELGKLSVWEVKTDRKRWYRRKRMLKSGRWEKRREKKNAEEENLEKGKKGGKIQLSGQ